MLPVDKSVFLMGEDFRIRVGEDCLI